MRAFLTTLALGALLPFAPPLAADEEGSDAADLLGKSSIGDHWYGPDLKVEDLKGRITLIEFWGFN